MSTYTSEPGTRLSGRYRLVDQVSGGGGWTLWKAIDETLARPVSVLTFAEGFPRITEAVTAARAASRLTDPRLSQVFDVDDTGERAYAVLEWVVGDTLADLLADGPLPPGQAVRLVMEAAQALAVAHAAGLAHLRLCPESLRWTPGGGVKVNGLGIDAALAGAELTGTGLTSTGLTSTQDPALTDTRDLSRLLYAALTGYWPGADSTTLPSAPESDGVPCTPRQVSAGVPANVDAVTCQALFQRAGRSGPPITTPAAFADALAGVAPPAPLPDPAPRMRQRSQNPEGYGYPDGRGTTRPTEAASAAFGQEGQGEGTAAWAHVSPPTRGGAAYRRGNPLSERSVAARAMISVVIVLILAAVGATAWMISHSLHKSATANGHGASSAPSVAASVVLKPTSARSFDVYGSDGGNEDNVDAPKAIDGSNSTLWHTSFYIGNPVFGGLKKGTGLLIDMGKSVKLSQVQVQFGTVCCADVQVEIGSNSNPVPSSLSNFTTVATSDHAVGTTTFTSNSSATGRYVLIWFTSLPRQAGQQNQYQAQIYNVVVRGSDGSA